MFYRIRAIRAFVVLSLLLFVTGCSAELERNSPYDPATPSSEQAKATVSGVITLENETDYSGIAVELQGDSTYSVETDPTGSFRIAGVVPGGYMLRAYTRHFEVKEQPISLKLGSLEVVQLELPAKRVHLSGKALAQELDERSLITKGGVDVSLFRTGSIRTVNSNGPSLYTAGKDEEDPKDPVPLQTTVSRSDGEYDFGEVPSGTYTLKAMNDDGRIVERKDIEVTGEDGDLELPEIVVPKVTGFFDIEGTINGFPSNRYTQDKEVTLRLYGFNAVKMQIGRSEDGTADACSWEEPMAHVALLTYRLQEQGANSICVRYFGEDGKQTKPLVQSIVFDGTPPVASRLIVEGGAAYTTRDIVTVELAAFDATSAVDKMQLSFSGSFIDVPAQPFTTSLALPLPPGQGEKTLWARFQDGAQNWSSPVSTAVIYDTEAPAGGSILINDGGTWATETRVNLALLATGASEMQIANEGNFNGVPWEPYRLSSLWVLENTQGTRTVSVKFRDEAGNVAGPFSSTIQLDSEPPSSPAVVINGGDTWATDAQVELATSAVGATWMRVSNDGIFDTEPLDAYATSVTSWALAGTDGTKTVYVRFADDAGNVSPVAAASIQLDRTAPTAGAPSLNNGADYTTSSDVVLSLPAGDASQVYLSTAGCQSGASWRDYLPTLDFDLGAATGLRTVWVTYRDPAGNVSPCRNATITYDPFLYAPTLALAVHGPEAIENRTRTQNVTVTFSGLTTDVSEIMLSDSSAFTGGGWQPVTTSIAWTLSAGDAEKTVYFKARDAAGNESGTLDASITLDQTGPDAPGVSLSDITGDGHAVSENQVEIEWSAPGDPYLEGYEVQRYVPGYDDGFVTSLDASTATTSMADNVSATTGLPHYYRVRAVDDLGNTSGWSITIEAHPFAPLRQAVWLKTATATRMMFAPGSGAFSLRSSRIYEDLGGVEFEESLNNDTPYWDRPDSEPERFSETLFIKTGNQDNSLSYESAVPTQFNKRRLIGPTTYGYVDAKVDAEGNPHYLNNAWPYVRYAKYSDGTWSETTFGYYPYQMALDVDEAGKAHVVYPEGLNPYLLRYHTNQSGAWIGETITTAVSDPGLPLDIATDASGQAHVFYQSSGTLYYANRNGGSWAVTAVTNGAAPAIEVGSDGKVYLAYQTGGEIQIRTSADNFAAAVTVDTGVGSTRVTDLEVDSVGGIHLAYTAPGLGTIRYASSNTAWVPEDVATAGASRSVSLSLDRRGGRHVGFRNAAANTFQLATSTGAGWSLQTFAPSNGNDEEVAVAAEFNGRVHAFYVETTKDEIRHFIKEVASSDRNLTSGTSEPDMVIDAEGSMHTAFAKLLSMNALTYGKVGPSGYTEEQVDPIVTTSPSIALDSAGTVHIVYDDNWASKIKYAENATAWTKTVLANGRDASIAIDADDTLHVILVNSGIRYLSKTTDGAWSPETPLGAGTRPQLVVDAAGVLHATWASTYSLMYGKNSGAGWTSEPVPSLGSGVESAVASRDGVAHVAWIDRGTLYYGNNAAEDWGVKKLDFNLGPDTSPVSMTIDENGNLALLYVDVTRTRIKFATNATGGWTVAPLHTGERMAVLEIDRKGNLHGAFVGTPADNYYGLHYLTDFFGFLPAREVRRVTAW